jgi:hypothetical protein
MGDLRGRGQLSRYSGTLQDEGSVFDSRAWARDFLFFTRSRLIMGPPQPPINAYRGFFPGGKVAGA